MERSNLEIANKINEKLTFIESRIGYLTISDPEITVKLCLGSQSIITISSEEESVIGVCTKGYIKSVIAHLEREKENLLNELEQL